MGALCSEINLATHRQRKPCSFFWNLCYCVFQRTDQRVHKTQPKSPVPCECRYFFHVWICAFLPFLLNVSGGKMRRHFNDHLHAETLISPSDLLFFTFGAGCPYSCWYKNKIVPISNWEQFKCTKGKTKVIIRFLYSYERTYTTDASEFTSIYVMFF